MKSEWRLQSNPVAGEMYYIPMRIRDTSKVIHSGNIEHFGEYTLNKAEAEEIVRKLNSGEIKP